MEKKHRCLAACVDQQNEVAVTTSRLPNRQTFPLRPEFCSLVARLTVICRAKCKKEELDHRFASWQQSLLPVVIAVVDVKSLRIPCRFPNLCSLILEIEATFNSSSVAVRNKTFCDFIKSAGPEGLTSNKVSNCKKFPTLKHKLLVGLVYS